MSAHCHCQSATSRWRRIAEVAGWLFPTTTLALLPKCPACVAAYVALATGIGISMPAAAHLRAMMVFFCAASLIHLATSRIKRFINATAAAEF